MWTEETKNGKYKFVERFTDPLTGRYRRVSIVMDKNTARSQKDAQRALNSKIDALFTPVEKKLNLSQLLTVYEAEQKRTVKLSTYDRNKSACASIKEILGGETIVDRLTAGYVRERFLASGKANVTLNEYLKRFKALIRWGYRNDYVQDISFLSKLELFPDKTKREKIQDKYLEADELRMLTQSMCVPKWKMLTEFLALSGLRFGEAAALLRSDLDLKARVIHVNKNYDQAHDLVTTPKTLTSIRDVYMQDELYTLCRSILICTTGSKIYPISNVLFVGTAREHIMFDSYAKYLRETSQKVLGRRITPHTLRHTHASLLMEQGVPVESISRRLGHTNSKITREIYLHVTKKLEERENSQLKEIKIL